MAFRFKEDFSFSARHSDSNKIKKKYPDRIPVIVERYPSSKIADIDKHKFLVPADVTVGQFLFIIRKRIEISKETALYLIVKKDIPKSTSTIGQLYTDFRDDDGFLYVHYSGENSFGY